MTDFFKFGHQVCWWPIDQGATYFCGYNRSAYTKSLFEKYSITFTRALERAVEKRQAEYLAGRFCGKSALHAISSRASSIPSGKNREPLWPKGIVGSISHTNEFAVACVSRSSCVAGIGIDIEEIISIDTVKKIKNMILTKNEKQLGAHMPMPEENYFSLLFSFKESFFKAAFSNVGRYFDFDAVSVIELDRARCCCKIKLNYDLSEKLTEGKIFLGLYQKLEGGLVVTMVVIPS